MITSKDLQPIVVALNSIHIQGSQDIGTMKNIFDYLAVLSQRADESIDDSSDEGESDEK
ncbi:MAG: hypothetical protein ACI4IW_05485 [Oscillospiraceae bacterium]